MGVSGPTYESTTEVKFLRQIGVDSVGMSTVPEIIAAHHCGVKIIGLSLITNKAVMPGETGPAASHQEVLETAADRAEKMQSLVKEIVSRLKSELPAMADLPKIDLTRTDAACAARPVAPSIAPLLAAVVAGVALGTILSTRILAKRS